MYTLSLVVFEKNLVFYSSKLFGKAFFIGQDARGPSLISSGSTSGCRRLGHCWVSVRNGIDLACLGNTRGVGVAYGFFSAGLLFQYLGRGSVF